MSDSNAEDIEQPHKRAICPECGFQNVTVLTAPRKPPKIYCTDCQWESLEADR
jgi:C4-type Zn-finger protein